MGIDIYPVGNFFISKFKNVNLLLILKNILNFTKKCVNIINVKNVKNVKIYTIFH